jgi:dTDP-4-amino-4,6-dideoxygalactose transaminase
LLIKGPSQFCHLNLLLKDEHFGQATVQFFVPFFDEDEAQEVVKTIKSNWLTSGPKCAEFEAEIGKYLGDPDIHVITVNSATSGLHLALEALGIGPGDEVLMPTLTFTATAEVVR